MKSHVTLHVKASAQKVNYILFPSKFMFHQFMSDMASVEMIIDQLKFPLLIISKLGISPFQVFDNAEAHTQSQGNWKP